MPCKHRTVAAVRCAMVNCPVMSQSGPLHWKTGWDRGHLNALIGTTTRGAHAPEEGGADQDADDGGHRAGNQHPPRKTGSGIRRYPTSAWAACLGPGLIAAVLASLGC